MKSTAKIAHLILVHKNTGHLERMVEKLTHPEARIYIHLDKKATLNNVLIKLNKLKQVTFIKKRTDIKWGAFSMVNATLKSFDEILEHPTEKYDFINLISESDYPLVPAEIIHEFLGQNKGKSFMEYEESGSKWLKTAHTKVFRYHLVDYRFPGKY